MKLVLLEELKKYKELPYDIFNGDGNLLFPKGEPLNSSKLVFLESIPVILKDENVDAEKSNKDEKEGKEFDVLERYDFVQSEEKVKNSFDSLVVKSYKGPLNKMSRIDPDSQIKMKAVVSDVIEHFQQDDDFGALKLLFALNNKIINDLYNMLPQIQKASELIFLGEYKYCHMLNTAVLTLALANKMGYSKETLSSLVLAALMHDIGKYKMTDDQNIMEHPVIGYEIIKNELNLPNAIALAVLQHHEHNDGRGYPNGISGAQISESSNIISICSTFDNLIFNRTRKKIHNVHEAIRALMSIGTNYFLPNVFYTFINMVSYNDVMPLEAMLLE